MKAQRQRDFVFADLDVPSVVPDRAAAFAAEFFVWWMQAGRTYYAFHDDSGLKTFARESVRVLGGWRSARRLLRSTTVEARS